MSPYRQRRYSARKTQQQQQQRTLVFYHHPTLKIPHLGKSRSITSLALPYIFRKLPLITQLCHPSAGVLVCGTPLFGDGGVAGDEVPLLRCDERGHAAYTAVPSIESAGQPVPAPGTRALPPPQADDNPPPGGKQSSVQRRQGCPNGHRHREGRPPRCYVRRRSIEIKLCFST